MYVCVCERVLFGWLLKTGLADICQRHYLVSFSQLNGSLWSSVFMSVKDKEGRQCGLALLHTVHSDVSVMHAVW